MSFSINKSAAGCLRKRFIGHVFFLFALAALVSCGLFSSGPPSAARNETKTILFKCDRVINQGMLLPVDVIYVTANDNLKEITQIGPLAWFESKQRDGWPYKQTLNLKSGVDVRLRLDKPPDTVYIVIFASFFQVNDAAAEQVILPPTAGKDRSAQEQVVWVAARALYH